MTVMEWRKSKNWRKLFWKEKAVLSEIVKKEKIRIEYWTPFHCGSK